MSRDSLTVSALNSCVEPVGKHPSVPVLSGLSASLVMAAYFYMRLIPRDFFTFASLDSVPARSGQIPGFVPFKTAGWTLTIKLLQRDYSTVSSPRNLIDTSDG